MVAKNYKDYNMNEQKQHWVGIDVAKDTFDAALVFYGHHYSPEQIRKVPVKTFTRSVQGVGQFLKWIDGLTKQHSEMNPASVRVVMESTGKYSMELSAWLVGKRASLEPAIANAAMTANFIKSLGIRNKTDRMEARALAYYGVERRPAPYEPPTGVYKELRELCRFRDEMVKEQTACKNRNNEASSNPVIRRLAKRKLREIEKHIKDIEKEIRKVLRKDEKVKKDYDLLVSIPGVSFVTACVVLGELGDLRRFERARQLSAFAGLSPRQHRSGTSVNGKPHLCKSGNPRIRRVLYMAAMSAVQYCPSMEKHYTLMLFQGKSKMAGLGAVMRKLLVLMRAILIGNTAYNPAHKRCGKLCGKTTSSCG
jgi:transposase